MTAPAPVEKSVVERFHYVFQSVIYLSDEMVLTGVTRRALLNQTGTHVFLGALAPLFQEKGLSIEGLLKLQAMNADFAPFAKKEVESGFHTVHLHALTNMWGVTYNAITFAIAEQIASDKTVQGAVCLSLNDKKNATKDMTNEEAEMLAGRLLRGQLGTLPAEVAFPAAAAIAGINFAPHEDTSSLEEARLARNAYVHGDGCIGPYEAGRVPSLSSKLGQKFVLSEEIGQRYNDSMGNFIVALGAAILSSVT